MEDAVPRDLERPMHYRRESDQTKQCICTRVLKEDVKNYMYFNKTINTTKGHLCLSLFVCLIVSPPRGWGMGPRGRESGEWVQGISKRPTEGGLAASYN